MAVNINLPFVSARQALPSLVIGGQDILLGLASQNILSFCYTDNTSDKADDLKIEIADPRKTWMQVYLPKKGIECDANIRITNWFGPGDNRTLNCGHFWIDEVTFKGPPNCVSIKGTSIPVTAGLKNQKKTRSWENSDLKSIAGKIAEDNQLTLFYDTQQNPRVKRTDQVEKADMEYLRDRAKEATLSVKVHNKQLVVYSEKEYEERDAAFTIIYGASNILEWDFISKLDDTYKKCKNSYVNPETGKLHDTEYQSEHPPEGTEDYLLINERPEMEPDEPDNSDSVLMRSQFSEVRVVRSDFVDYRPDPAKDSGKGAGGNAASTRKCKAKLREKNKKEKTSSIKCVGNISYLSGLNVQIQGFGIFDQKWFIESSVHDVTSGGYTTDLKLRGTLKGY